MTSRVKLAPKRRRKTDRNVRSNYAPRKAAEPAGGGALAEAMRRAAEKNANRQ